MKAAVKIIFSHGINWWQLRELTLCRVHLLYSLLQLGVCDMTILNLVKCSRSADLEISLYRAILDFYLELFFAEWLTPAVFFFPPTLPISSRPSTDRINQSQWSVGGALQLSHSRVMSAWRASADCYSFSTRCHRIRFMQSLNSGTNLNDDNPLLTVSQRVVNSLVNGKGVSHISLTETQLWHPLDKDYQCETCHYWNRLIDLCFSWISVESKRLRIRWI